KKFADEQLKFDLIILDPPYGKNMVNGILEFLLTNKMLNNNCTIVIEELKEVVFKEFADLKLIKKYEYGITALNIYEYEVA
uniref:RsmD family RNA methyltransferase n=1 Tax=Thomasclavelia sp. TaxID=3025757 RepID=UPI0025F61159